MLFHVHPQVLLSLAAASQIDIRLDVAVYHPILANPYLIFAMATAALFAAVQVSPPLVSPSFSWFGLVVLLRICSSSGQSTPLCSLQFYAVFCWLLLGINPCFTSVWPQEHLFAGVFEGPEMLWEAI